MTSITPFEIFYLTGAIISFIVLVLLWIFASPKTLRKLELDFLDNNHFDDNDTALFQIIVISTFWLCILIILLFCVIFASINEGLNSLRSYVQKKRFERKHRKQAKQTQVRKTKLADEEKKVDYCVNNKFPITSFNWTELDDEVVNDIVLFIESGYSKLGKTFLLCWLEKLKQTNTSNGKKLL